MHSEVTYELLSFNQKGIQMMDHKWTKTSTEKTMTPDDNINKGNEDKSDIMEIQRKDEKLSSSRIDVNGKNDLSKKQTSIAQEAIQGWEKAETEVLALKQELEKATQHREALNECMLQLRCVREEQEKRIHDAVIKSSKEHEKRNSTLEENLNEFYDKVSKLELENSQLKNSLSSKEKTIDAVVSQLESTQRENASLSYEIRVLEKELEIRNEEREFNRRTADVAHKQYLSSVKKIAQLETEAQRLRLLVQKRLPGPADVAKMKTAVDNRRKSNPLPIASKITFLTEQLCSFEEENRLLKEFLNQKSKSQTVKAATSSEIGSDEKVSLVESWAPSCNTIGASDIGLMDDFVEMEKLALEDIKKNETPEYSNVLLNSGVNKSIQRVIEIIEGVKLSKKDDNLSPYTVHIFQWKLCEIRDILEGFLKSCNELLNGKVGMEEFCKELTFALEWIVNHCFSLQDVSSMKDEIKKHFESEVAKSGPAGQTGKFDFDFPKDQLPGWPMAASWNVDVNDPIKTIDECSEANKEPIIIEEKEKEKSSNEESKTVNVDEKYDLEKDESALPSEKEIMEASEKLAECQETIINLGKQLKALGSSPMDSTSLSDSCEITVSPSPKRNSNQRISLLDKMITEDATGALRTQKSKGADGNLYLNPVMSPKMFVSVEGVKDEKDEEDLVNFLSIVTKEKKSGGGGILRRMFGRKKGNK